jgi:tetratricopeptide (TPR) repeat protein
MSKRPWTIFILLVCVLAPNSSAQDSKGISFGLLATPEIAIPVGSTADYYRLGFGGKVSGLFGFERFPYISPRIDLSYNYIPIKTESTASLSLIRASLGAQGTLLFGEHFSLFGYGTVGGYYGLLVGPFEANDLLVSFHGGAGANLQLFKDILFSLGAEYESYIGTINTFTIFLGINARIAGQGGGPVPLHTITPIRPDNLPVGGYIEIRDVQLETVFPVLLKHYDSTPIGTAVIKNISEESVESIEVRTKPAKYIDSTKLSARIPSLAPGEETTVDLYALFNEQILNVSEGAKVVTDIDVTYRVNEREGADKETVTLEIYDRNALQWDDDKKIAAFVTAKDDEIQRFAKNMASIAQDVRVDAISQHLQLAMLQYSAMVEQGLTYVVDPSSAYEDFSENPFAIDFIQFPRQTLYVKAGDCDDLSATYCTLLESIGIDTAFITVPGHIFMAFRLEMEEREARSTFTNPDDLIIQEDESVWIPIETTLLDDGFLRAWALGAKEWRSHRLEEQAGFFTTAEAWRTYQPVAFSVSQIELGLPQRASVVSRFEEELNKFISQEIYPTEQRLLSRLSSDQNDPVTMNKLGVLFARFGRYSDAKQWFEKCLRLSNHVPAMINLANIHFIAGDFGRAKEMYEKAIDEAGDKPAALLGLARVEYEMENFGSAREAYDRLAIVSSKLAEQYTYLRSAGSAEEEQVARAADLRIRVVWEEEK